MIQIKNLQKIKKINQAKIRQKTRKIFKILKVDGVYVSLVFCGNNFIRKINRRYLKRNRATDVICFPLKDEFTPGFLGEIVISVEEAAKNADIYKTSFDSELTLYIIHGVLHLLGWRDYTKRERLKMERKQEEILKKLIVASHKLQVTGHKLEA